MFRLVQVLFVIAMSTITLSGCSSGKSSISDLFGGKDDNNKSNGAEDTPQADDYSYKIVDTDQIQVIQNGEVKATYKWAEISNKSKNYFIILSRDPKQQSLVYNRRQGLVDHCDLDQCAKYLLSDYFLQIEAPADHLSNIFDWKGQWLERIKSCKINNSLAACIGASSSSAMVTLYNTTGTKVYEEQLPGENFVMSLNDTHMVVNNDSVGRIVNKEGKVIQSGNAPGGRYVVSNDILSYTLNSKSTVWDSSGEVLMEATNVTFMPSEYYGFVANRNGFSADSASANFKLLRGSQPTITGPFRANILGGLILFAVDTKQTDGSTLTISSLMSLKTGQILESRPEISEGRQWNAPYTTVTHETIGAPIRISNNPNDMFVVSAKHVATVYTGTQEPGFYINGSSDCVTTYTVYNDKGDKIADVHDARTRGSGYNFMFDKDSDLDGPGILRIDGCKIDSSEHLGLYDQNGLVATGK